jgi:transposase
MLTRMTEADWGVALEVFTAAQSRSGVPGHDDRRFLEAVHYFTVHSITWRALPAEFGNWDAFDLTDRWNRWDRRPGRGANAERSAPAEPLE